MLFRSYDSQRQGFVDIGPSWTRGLAIHPVGKSPTLDTIDFPETKLILCPIATGVTFIAFLLSLSSHVTVTLLASLTSFLAAVLTLIAFAVDIALYAFLKHEVGKLSGVSSNTDTAPGEFQSTPLAFFTSLPSAFLPFVWVVVRPVGQREDIMRCFLRHDRCLRTPIRIAPPRQLRRRAVWMSLQSTSPLV